MLSVYYTILKTINKFGTYNGKQGNYQPNKNYYFVMKTYLIILVVIFSIAIIAGIINNIAEKHNKYSLTTELTHIIANVFGLISIFMFIGGLLTIFC